uniref:spermatogenesis-associated protein 21-like isoform X2 n=1 Tax=Oncorhynchus gorbuscha TaxID=8017 RepID=UPI001EAF07F0|nr:spermatogenesis-associated protein 21-like isoform X2 [Oncorhynchus gorbuscha]
MEEDRSWKEEAQKKVSSFLVKLRLKNPLQITDNRSSSESERANAEVRQRAVMQSSVEGKTLRSTQGTIRDNSLQHSPPTGTDKSYRGAEGSTSPDNIDSDRKKTMFPLLFTKTAVAGTTTNPLLTENDQPSGKLSAEAEKAHKTVMVAGIPEEIGVGAKVMQKTLPVLSKLIWSRPSPSEEDDKVQGKVKDFHKTKLGEQKEDNVPPIAKEPRRKGSPHGAEQGRGRDYSRRKEPLSYDIQHRLNQAMTDSDRLKAREVIKRSGTIRCENLQQRPNRQKPELERFKPRDITKRRAIIPCDELQQRPHQPMPKPDKAALVKLPAIPRWTGSISYEEYQKLNQKMPDSTINTEDLEEFLNSLGITHIEDLATTVPDDPLTDAQSDAFKEVFEQFAKNSDVSLNEEGLASTLDRVGISISPEEVKKALQKADYDEDGGVGFQDFLHVMADSQRFSKCLKGADPSQSVEVCETVFYKALTRMLAAGILSSGTTTEIVQYYHKKTLRLIRQAVRPDREDGDHVLTYYTKGAHLKGLKSKQLLKYIQPVETIAQSQKVKDSPYSRCPSLNVAYTSWDPRRMSLNPAQRAKMGHVKSVKTWKTAEIEDRIRQLSIKHPGMEKMEMITPVKMKVNMSMKERDHLTYNEINQIKQMSKSSLKEYLKDLTQLKRRDMWISWGSLQCYCALHSRKDFTKTFTTYSWSWSGCRNMMETGDLDAPCRSALRPHVANHWSPSPGSGVPRPISEAKKRRPWRQPR